MYGLKRVSPVPGHRYLACYRHGKSTILLGKLFFYRSEGTEMKRYPIDRPNDFINVLPTCIINWKFPSNGGNPALYKYSKSPSVKMHSAYSNEPSQVYGIVLKKQKTKKTANFNCVFNVTNRRHQQVNYSNVVLYIFQIVSLSRKQCCFFFFCDRVYFFGFTRYLYCTNNFQFRFIFKKINESER